MSNWWKSYPNLIKYGSVVVLMFANYFCPLFSFRGIHVIFFPSQALKQMMQQLDHERNLKLGAFERVEDLQRQVCRVFFVFFIVWPGIVNWLLFLQISITLFPSFQIYEYEQHLTSGFSRPGSGAGKLYGTKIFELKKKSVLPMLLLFWWLSS